MRNSPSSSSTFEKTDVSTGSSTAWSKSSSELETQGSGDTAAATQPVVLIFTAGMIILEVVFVGKLQQPSGPTIHQAKISAFSLGKGVTGVT